MMQLAFDFQTKRDPFTCPHIIRTTYDVKAGLVLCGIDGKHTYVNCHESVAGEPPRCTWEPLDNTPETVARRLEWLQEQAK